MKIERLILREAIESTGKPLRTGGSTFYVRNGKLCVQSSTRPEHSGKNWKRTPARTKSNRRFAALRNVSTYLKEVYAGLPVWGTARHSGQVLRLDVPAPAMAGLGKEAKANVFGW